MQLRKSQESLAHTVGWLVGCRREAEDEKKKERKRKSTSEFTVERKVVAKVSRWNNLK